MSNIDVINAVVNKVAAGDAQSVGLELMHPTTGVVVSIIIASGPLSDNGYPQEGDVTVPVDKL